MVLLYMMAMVPLGIGWPRIFQKGLSIRERTCYASIAHLDKKASKQDKEGNGSLIDRCFWRR